jgi:hypothetical protein
MLEVSVCYKFLTSKFDDFPFVLGEDLGTFIASFCQKNISNALAITSQSHTMGVKKLLLSASLL